MYGVSGYKRLINIIKDNSLRPNFVAPLLLWCTSKFLYLLCNVLTYLPDPTRKLQYICKQSLKAISFYSLKVMSYVRQFFSLNGLAILHLLKQYFSHSQSESIRHAAYLHYRGSLYIPTSHFFYSARPCHFHCHHLKVKSFRLKKRQPRQSNLVSTGRYFLIPPSILGNGIYLFLPHIHFLPFYSRISHMLSQACE